MREEARVRGHLRKEQTHPPPWGGEHKMSKTKLREEKGEKKWELKSMFRNSPVKGERGHRRGKSKKIRGRE